MKKRLLALGLNLFLVCQVLLTPAFALTGFEVISGNVSLQQTGNTFNITSNSTQAIVQWQSFNVNSGQTVNFLLPTNTSSILNRVLGGNASNILGNINSNGTVLLSNTAGINIGATANINTGGFVASTLNLSNSNYLNDNWVFTRPDGTSPAGILNEGNISTSTGGFVVLAGGVVMNTGNIFAPEGTVHLAVGDEIRIALGENTVVDVIVNQSLMEQVNNYQSAISNLGTIDARTIMLQADLLEAFYATTINNEGVLKATTTSSLGNSIRVYAFTDDQQATLNNGGIVDVSGTELAFDGGTLEMVGDSVLQDGTVSAEAYDGGKGGSILISSSNQTVLASGSVTSASGGTGTGQAGEIIVWSDEDTYFESGAIVDVSGGDVSGDGGFVEISGYETVYFQGQAYGGSVDGEAGSILIDPLNIIIDNAGADAVAGGDNPGGVDETFGEDAGLTMTFDPQAGGGFNGFGDIHLQATNDITVNSAFDTSIATGNPSVALTLEADGIIVNAPITTTNADLSLIANSFINVNGSTSALNATGTGNLTLQVTGAGSINIGDGSDLNAGNNLTISNPSAGSIFLSNGGSLSAGNDLTVTGGGWVSLHWKSGPVGNNLNISTTGGFLRMTNADFTVGNDATIANTAAAGIWDDVELDGGTSIIAGNNIDITSTNGSVEFDTFFSPIRAGNTLTATAGDTILLDGGDVESSGDIILNATNAVEIGFFGGDARADNDLILNAPIIQNDGGGAGLAAVKVNLISDADGDNSGSIALNMPINLRIADGFGEALNIVGAEIDLNNTITLAGASDTLGLRSSTNKTINLGGAADSADTGAIMDISDAELARISADRVTVGSTGNSSNLEIIGAVDVTGQYDLVLNSGGDINSTLGGNVITGGGNDITLNSTGNIDLTNGGIDGGGGLINLSATGSGSDISFGGDINSANAITLNADGSINANAEIIGNTIDLTAGSSIIDGNGAANNLTSVANSNITTNSLLGSQSDALEVNVGGTLTVQAAGMNASGTVGELVFLGSLNDTPLQQSAYYDGLLGLGDPLLSSYSGFVLFNGVSLSELQLQVSPTVHFLSKNNDFTETRNAINSNYFTQVQESKPNSLSSPLSPNNLVRTPSLPVNTDNIEKARHVILKNGKLQLSSSEF